MLKGVTYILRKLDEGWGKLRRFYLVHYREDYVLEQLRLRRGECRRCGSCCRIMFQCPHLRGENQCDIYNCRYKQCMAFPIDDRDLKYLRHTCGHYFVRWQGHSSLVKSSDHVAGKGPLPASGGSMDSKIGTTEEGRIEVVDGATGCRG